jgi:hypothetical protein
MFVITVSASQPWIVARGRVCCGGNADKFAETFASRICGLREGLPRSSRGAVCWGVGSAANGVFVVTDAESLVWPGVSHPESLVVMRGSALLPLRTRALLTFSFAASASVWFGGLGLMVLIGVDAAAGRPRPELSGLISMLRGFVASWVVVVSVGILSVVQ